MCLRYRSYCKQFLQMKSIVNSRFFFKFRSVIKYCAIMITHVFASINRGNSTALTTSNSLRKDSKYTDNWFIYIIYKKYCLFLFNQIIYSCNQKNNRENVASREFKKLTIRPKQSEKNRAPVEQSSDEYYLLLMQN